MKTICRLENTIQNYAWGSKDAISTLTGKPNTDNIPQAELWMGAHPKAPSRIVCKGNSASLADSIEKYPVEMLGEKTALAFNNGLPFLFKVLAAEKPLSIQAHPGSEQAKEGFERENRLNIPMDAFNRNYKDPNHKPECICALSPFWALNGFRPVDQILAYLETLCPEILGAEREHLKNNPDSRRVKDLFKALLSLSTDEKNHLIARAVKSSETLLNQDPVYEWIFKLYEEYHQDAGILSPALLNLVCLQPGQAMYLPAGRLHAYLQGLGIELMANSDNVLRGGCTPKHMDLAELLKVVDFEPHEIQILEPVERNSVSEAFYTTPAREFLLSVIKVNQNIIHSSARERSLEILLCTEGKAHFRQINDRRFEDEVLEVSTGESVMVPADAKPYRIQGHAVFYKASVP